MSRIRHLPWVMLVPFGLAVAVGATDAPKAEQASANQIDVPRLEGIIGPPSADLSAAVAAPAPEAKPADAKPAEPSKATAVATQDVPALALAPELAERLGKDKSGSTKDDREAAARFYDGRQGAPLWVSDSGLTPQAEALIKELGKAADWGLSPDVFKIPAAPGKAASRAELVEVEAGLTFAALKYARHARGGRVEPTQLSKYIDRKAQVLPAAKVMETLGSAEAPDAALRKFHPQHAQFEKLRQMYLAVRSGVQVIDPPAPPVETADNGKAKKQAAPAHKPLTPQQIEKKLLANMEMYRWMPEFGAYYIQPNIPEFMVRVVKDSKVIHAERVITGKPETMTPTFSDEMRLVVFKPDWNVPESIKTKEMLPQLLRSRGALESQGLKAEYNGKPLDPKTVDWTDVDMREIRIFQPPGDTNVLGKVKFRFPNKHDVYLHDTSSRNLFNNSVRAYSHGCVRVRDPLKLAEILLGNDKNMSRADVDRLANAGPENNEIKIAAPVPIHITYFTAWVDDDGKLKTVPDIYGHENRVHMGLDGKAHLIVHPKEEKYVPPSPEERRKFAELRKSRQAEQTGKDPVQSFFKSIFNF